MNMGKQRDVMISIPCRLLLVGVVVSTLACSAQHGDPAGIPSPDLSSMEQSVARLLETTRAAVVAAPDSAAAWGELGEVYQAHNLVDEAATCYREASAFDPGAFEWAYLLAVSRDRGGAGIDELRTLYRAAADLRPDYIAAPLRLGLALSRHGDAAAARVVLEQVVERDPDIAIARRGLGQALLAEGDVEQALPHLQRATELNPQDSAAFAALAQALGQIGETSAAREAARRSSVLLPMHAIPDPLLESAVVARGVAARHEFSRARGRIAAGELDAAIEGLEALEIQRPDDADVQYLLGVAHFRAGRGDAAMQHLLRALELNEGHLHALGEIARLQLAAGQVDAALETLARAQRLAPQDPGPLVAEARIHFQRGDMERLIATYERLAEVSPTDAVIRVDLGTAWGRSGDPERAAAEFRRAIEIDAENPDAHYRLGVALEQLGRNDEALEHFRIATRIDPTHPAAARLDRPLSGD